MESIILPTTTYHCTISSICMFSTTKFEAWVSHELTSHPANIRDVWLCHPTPSVPECTCNLAFVSRTDFEKNWFSIHPKDELDNWQPLRHEEYYLGPEADRLFWCGFCRKVFSCHMTQSWTVDRFEHVAAHFQMWHATWDHFEIQTWRYLDFWVEPAPVVKVEAKADGSKDESTKLMEKDGIENSKHAKHSKGAKEPKAGKDTKSAKNATAGKTDKIVANAGKSESVVKAARTSDDAV